MCVLKQRDGMGTCKHNMASACCASQLARQHTLNVNEPQTKFRVPLSLREQREKMAILSVFVAL